MTDTAISPRRASGGGNVDGARPLRRRRALPGGRAVVGGFLVALSTVGIFAGYTGATADARRPVLVASDNLPLGHRIVDSDLTVLLMDVPPALRARSYGTRSELVGALVIGPIGKGDLVQKSDVLRAEGQVSGQISFPIESARAVDGGLRPGEFVDVVATYGTGVEAYTVVVVRGARVAHRTTPRGALSESGNEVVTLALRDRADALAVAHAVHAGSMTLVRAGALDAGAPAPARSSYTPPAPASRAGTTRD